MKGFSVNDWYAIDMNGKEMSGEKLGAFHVIKDIPLHKLWVLVNGKKIEAPGKGPDAKLDFKIRITMDINMSDGKKRVINHKIWLFAYYPEKTILKIIDIHGNVVIVED